jgi:hypothetical protein
MQFSRLIFALLLLCGLATLAVADVDISGKSYPSVQAALDANPGQLLRLPAGDYPLEHALRITKSGSGLCGEGRLIQSNPAEDIIVIDKADDVRIRDLVLTRAEGKQDATQAAISAQGCAGLEISNVQIHENRSPKGSIYLKECRQSRVNGCLVRNYKRISIDDRTASKDLSGYAFRCIDGTGIQVNASQGIQITNNRVLEFNYIPTKENRDKYNLGSLTVVPEKPGRLMPKDVFETHYTNNWHQGAGLQVSGPEKGDFVTITGNYFENPAQGMDIHCDHVVIANNEVNHAMIGMKAMHGSKHVLIEGNQFAYCDLWGLMLMPGSASHAAQAATGDKPAREDNSDGGTIVAHNIFSGFGMGDQYWNWEGRKTEYPERNPIVVLFGQLEENPPIRDIIITGNMVYDTGRDQKLVDGKPTTIAPKYFYALYVEPTRQPAPQRVQVRDNMFDPGMSGATNLPLAQ